VHFIKLERKTRNFYIHWSPH